MRIFEKRPKSNKRQALEIDHARRQEQLKSMPLFARLPPSAMKPFLGLDGTKKHIMPSSMGFAKDSLGRLVIM
jgi:hypothetical protein